MAQPSRAQMPSQRSRVQVPAPMMAALAQGIQHHFDLQGHQEHTLCTDTHPGKTSIHILKNSEFLSELSNVVKDSMQRSTATTLMHLLT